MSIFHGSDSLHFNYYSCPITKVRLFMHNAKQGACPICESMDGSWYCGDDGTVEPYDILQHDHCRCTWDWEYVEGLTEGDKEELEEQHSEIVSERDEAEADVAFIKYDMEELQRIGREHNEAGIDARAEARSHEEAARLLVNLVNETLDLIDQTEDEARIQELMDLADEYQRQADEQVQLMEAKDAEAETEEAAAEEAYQSWRNLGDELDAAEKRVIIWTEELLKVEPCLEWPLLQDQVEKITGSNVTYLI